MASNNSDGGLMQDPYAAAGSAPPSGALVGAAPSVFGGSMPSLPSDSYGSGALHIPDAPAPIPTPDFLFVRAAPSRTGTGRL